VLSGIRDKVHSVGGNSVDIWRFFGGSGIPKDSPIVHSPICLTSKEFLLQVDPEAYFAGCRSLNDDLEQRLQRTVLLTCSPSALSSITTTAENAFSL
jgi:hypothetical protein